MRRLLPGVWTYYWWHRAIVVSYSCSVTNGAVLAGGVRRLRNCMSRSGHERHAPHHPIPFGFLSSRACLLPLIVSGQVSRWMVAFESREVSLGQTSTKYLTSAISSLLSDKRNNKTVKFYHISAEILWKHLAFQCTEAAVQLMWYL